jgi:hypothetical protein
MTLLRCGTALMIAAMLGACATAPQQAPPVPPTSPKDIPSSPVVHESLPQQPAPPVQEAGPPPVPPVDAIPQKALYLCAKLVKGEITRTAIEFIPKVERVCRRHPEMWPCQYERNACRSNGGKVYTSEGEEITLATEAEYDKKVYRVRFRAD